LNQLVGQLAAEEFDLVSVRVIPANTDRWLGRLQDHEYRMAMRLRTLMPWMVSGACHAGRREAHRRIMERHTLFFQGNDVELGVIANQLNLKVGHVLFDVPTEVPDNLRAWWRQRYAWSGGEFRLFFMNPQIALKHPFLWAYGALITFAGVPFRWNAVFAGGWSILATALLYALGLAFLHRGHWDRWLPLLPIYTFISSLILVPLGAVAYIRMVQKHKNVGLIRARRPSATRTRPVRVGARTGVA
jgi:cellulose synthase/poly-beta-1,6-N-acetylglucosamine synthase-like glycosyltransferase